MAITAIGQNSALAQQTEATAVVKDKSVLGKDDFMKLLLIELQYQDPTAPMDSEKILTQTSQLAGLESTDKTTKALDALSASLGNSQQFTTISAIGKRADLGSDAISHDKGSDTKFEIYFPKDVDHGSIDITDADGKAVASLNIEVDSTTGKRDAGVYQFTWDGLDSSGNEVDSAIYHVNSKYVDSNGNDQTTRIGAYPIESVRFEEGKALLKLGSNYIPLENIKEVY